MATAMSESRNLQKKPKFTQLIELAGEKVGGRVLFATDDCFAVAENMLKKDPPVWKEGVFTEHGKWMDGWATRRKKIEGYDWCIIQLGVPGIIYGVDVDTSYFTGDYAPRCSVQAVCLDKKYPGRRSIVGAAATDQQFQDINHKMESEKWEYIVPLTDLQPGYKTSCHNYFTSKCRRRFTHIRLNIYPDGGVARLRVYGRGAPDWSVIPANQLVDLVSLENGGVCVGYSDAHYGHPHNLIQPGRAETGADGWLTARKATRPAVIQPDTKGVVQVPGTEWCVFRLGQSGVIRKIEIDTNHFKGDFPDICRIEGCYISEDQENEVIKTLTGEPWRTLLPMTKLGANKRMFLHGSAISNCGVISHVRLTIAPDGGISRLRIWGCRETAHNSKL